MEFTGERAIPGQTDPDLMNEHWARYAFAEALVGSKRVLDAGCGVGYGAARLAEVAAEVVALDQARDPLTAGGKQYSHPRLRFVQGDCTRFPFADSSLDAVVAFEVIEHLDEWKALIEESRRVLVPAGQFIVSTPNRLYYGEAREDPNPFHVHEFTHDEFREELGRCFPHVMLFLENHGRGLELPPKLAVGDGAMGFWAALRKVYPATREQRCWLHKTVNVLNKLPRSMQGKAKQALRDIYLAESRQTAEDALDRFKNLYEKKFPKAVECLEKDRKVLLAFYDFPAEHWGHLRTTNPIESTFATVRLRQRRTKGCGSREASLTMVFMLARQAERHWRRLNGSEVIVHVLDGKEFKDGLMVQENAA